LSFGIVYALGHKEGRYDAGVPSANSPSVISVVTASPWALPGRTLLASLRAWA